MRHARSFALATAAAAVWALFPSPHSLAAEPDPIKIAVFDFELADATASGGVIARDAFDVQNLKEAGEVARRMLSASGRYSVIDTSGVRGEVKGDIQDCRGCETGLARKVGADQSMAGVVTRVGRVEHTVQIVVRDARTGDIVSNSFSGLGMGANDSWPRAVTSLMNNKILPRRQPQ